METFETFSKRINEEIDFCQSHLKTALKAMATERTIQSHSVFYSLMHCMLAVLGQMDEGTEKSLLLEGALILLKAERKD